MELGLMNSSERLSIWWKVWRYQRDIQQR